MPFSGTVQSGASYLRETVVYVSGLLGRAEPVGWELWPDRWSCDSANRFKAWHIPAAAMTLGVRPSGDVFCIASAGVTGDTM